jgi:hypothetical protein
VKKPKKQPPDLFDHAARRAEAKAAKEAGMAQVAANANDDWSVLMLKLVRLTCLEQPSFTTDEPDDRYEAIEGDKPVTHDKRALGPVMMRAAKLGYCRKTNTVQASRRKKLHASPIAIWESLIYAV